LRTCHIGFTPPRLSIGSVRFEEILFAVAVIAVITATILTVCAITALILTSGHGSGLRIGLIGLFTVMTAGVLALAGAKKSEVFIRMIGYVAVLVVFVEGGDGDD
jgi:hypothetical protein